MFYHVSFKIAPQVNKNYGDINLPASNISVSIIHAKTIHLLPAALFYARTKT